MDVFKSKRNYRFKGGNQAREQRIFWVIVVVLSVIFMVIYHFNS